MKIAIVGKMRSGKDTVGNIFKDELHDCLQVNFGDGIKRIVRTYFPKIYAEGKPRTLLQKIGQDFRKLDPYVWVVSHSRDVEEALNNYPHEHVITTDLRQMNEYYYLKQKGFVVVKVEADEDLRKERIIKAGDSYDMSNLHHETEVAVDHIPYDFLITNNGTKEELQEKTLDLLYNHILKGDKDK